MHILTHMELITEVLPKLQTKLFKKCSSNKGGKSLTWGLTQAK